MSLLSFRNELGRRTTGSIGSGPPGVADGTPLRPLGRWRLLVRRVRHKIDRQVAPPVHREGPVDRDARPSPVEPERDRRRRELQQYLAPHALWPIRQSRPRQR
jgi:hypothetical protein